MSGKVVSLIFRRMRAPLLVLIGVYAVSVFGLVVIPGVDDQGQPWHMSFFHALYFISFMATTIGFGEIPYPFTEAQRLWVTVTIYLNVTTWIYAVGTILALIQDPAFRQALTGSRFARSVRRLREPFYLVCGYGDTGSLLVHGLIDRGQRAVVLDIDPQRIQELVLDEPEVFVPGHCADAADPQALLVAGLDHRCCAGVVAVTNDDHANLTIAITVKLLNPKVKVICRAETRSAGANMSSFGTDHIIDPFETFADHLAIALHSPGLYLLQDWLTGVPHSALAEPLYPPRGTWILCGFGRFGRAVQRYLAYEGITTRIIESNPEVTGSPEGTVVGKGTEAVTLREAGIKNAVGLVAGTDDDADNLSIIMTALELKPGLFVVARQNRRQHERLFQAVHSQLVMQPARIIARRILALLATPLMSDFLQAARERDAEWANGLVSRIAAVVGDEVPDIWAVTLNAEQAPAVVASIRGGRPVQLEDLLVDPRERSDRVRVIPLLLRRQSQRQLEPDESTGLQPGDTLLFCGGQDAADRMRWVLQNPKVLTYALTGREKPEGWVWQWLERRLG